jgi:type III restriction enzyme
VIFEKNFRAQSIFDFSMARKSSDDIEPLDALDAYNQKLVKKINVRGITVKGLTGTNA